MRQQELAFDGESEPQVRLERGPRCVETALLARIARDAAAVRADPSRLRQPLRILVPSQSLQLHVSGVAARHGTGGALAGVSVATLYGAALEILERAARPAPPASTLLPVLVRRAVAAHPRLGPLLSGLRNVEQAVEGGVHDLLDADLDPSHGPALEDAFAELASAGAEVEPARSVVEIALFCLREMDRCGIGHRSSLLRDATDCVERIGADVLPARGLLLHGFANATGRVTELIRALQRTHAAEILIDEPPAPDGGDPWPAARSFLGPFRERIESHPNIRRHEAAVPFEAPGLRAIRALGSQGEARAVALELRRALDAGEAPERIAVVARDPELHALPLRLHLERLGVPFSGLGTRGPGGAPERSARALSSLLFEGEDLPAERWLDLCLDLDAGARADLDLGLRHLGAARLRDVAGLDVRGAVALPVRGAPVEGEEGRDSGPARRRMLPESLLRATVGRARRLCASLAREARGAVLAEWCEELEERLVAQLGWSEEHTAAAPWLALLRGLSGSLDSALTIDADEFAAILQRRIADTPNDAIGGQGGGVQILSVMEARARTFDRLFLLGLNRDVFPRSIHEDPLLPDSVRLRLRDLLPDLPIKQMGFDEERYLFAQLLASAPEITVSWWEVDDDGRAQARSPFVDLLRRSLSRDNGSLVTDTAPPWLSNPSEGRLEIPALERAMRAGLARRTEAHARNLEEALRERRWRHPGRGSSADEEGAARGARRDGGVTERDAGELAATRIAVLREWDRFAGPEVPLGPYFGFVGPVSSPGDPRAADPHVTTLEAIGRCPWRAFLERVLRISAPPDPLEALPGATPLLVGSVVHRVLERLGETHGVVRGEDLSAVEAAAGIGVPWPAEGERFEWVREAAAEVLSHEGGAGPGLVDLVARVARPYVETAVARADPDCDERVLGVEISGQIEVPLPGGRRRVLRFRADRVARDAAERLLLIDYKTGKPPADAATPETRRKHMRDRIQRGEALQAAVYARAGDGAEGRYVSVKPDFEARRATVVVEADEPLLTEAFERSTAALFDAFDAGLFLPRLIQTEKDQAPDLCGHCEVASACLQRDTGASRRLRVWTEERLAGAHPQDTENDERLLALWSLHRKEKDPAPVSEEAGS